jgi:hypothetical protein
VVAPVVEEDGEEDSNSPTVAVEEEADTKAASKAATAASRVATTKTNSRVAVNGRRRSNPSYEFSLTSLENPKPRTAEQIRAWAVGAQRSSF